ncbi:hypothetical protein DRQ36_04610 [bacterium]|nr:MAG: hypothetical protein DRQ36_04610 [bacterium]
MITGRAITIISVILFSAILIAGCATTDFSKKASLLESIPEDEKGANPAYELLRSAEAAYAEGVVHNMKREWAEARADFDEALHLIAQVDASDDEDLSAQTDMLLREIAYDYRYSLAHTDSLEATAAPIVLSVALEDRALSEDTRLRLSELAGELPKALSGEFDFPVVWNDRVKEKIVFLQTDAREPFSEWLRRSGRYLPMIKEIFESRGLPTDLAYLPLIESGFSPGAYSWAHAVGMWQFVKSTGRIFGLKVNWWLDERRDVEKSTIAAADYYESLYKKFGDWELCLAAYNCGDGRIKRAIEKQRTDNYWEMDLPTETENYVPLFMAALIIAKNPEAYGFDIEPYPPYEFETIKVDEPTNLEIIAQCTDTSLSFIQELNPEILRYCTPPDITAYPIRVPIGKAETFAERYAAIPEEDRTVWARHKVRKGETLSEIALHYGTSVAILAETNRLKNAHRLSIGQELVIPVSPGVAKALAAKGSAPIPARTAPSGEGSINRYYTVKKNDTLSEIAEKHGVRLDDLLLANSLGKGSVIKPGLRLKIPYGRTKTTYTVRSGDTPSTIAARFGVRTEDFLNWNNLNRKSTIYPGQKLVVLATESHREPKGKIVHTVRKGESLWAIARRYNVHISEIVAWNGLSSKNVTLSIGQKLEIITDSPGGSGGYTTGRTRITYTVKKGDTLGKIASFYDVTVEAIQRWNNKSDTRLQIGDKLSIYTDKPAAADIGSPRTIKHKVRSGETMSEIAEQYGVTVNDIKTQNGKSSDIIVAGETLTIKTGKKIEESFTIHNVKPGETLSGIARQYGVTVSDLKEWNGKTGDLVLLGEELIIRGTVSNSPASGDKPAMISHVVEKGETLNRLAVLYGVSVDDIKEWNNKKTDIIHIGEVLTIYTHYGSDIFGAKNNTVTYKVQKGDTVWIIAQRYGTTTDAILRENNDLDPKRLRIGDILRINVGND